MVGYTTICCACWWLQAPPDGLADTTFADTTRGYEALPIDLVQRIAGLTASHSLANIPLMNGDDPTTRPDHSVGTHPMVLAMPPNGKRRAIYCTYTPHSPAQLRFQDV